MYVRYCRGSVGSLWPAMVVKLLNHMQLHPWPSALSHPARHRAPSTRAHVPFASNHGGGYCRLPCPRAGPAAAASRSSAAPRPAWT